MKLPVMLVAFLALVELGGCGAWKAESLEAATADRIDSRLPRQMSLDEFRKEFPDAQRVDGDADSGAWLVTDHHTCFWCRTPHGFQRSEDVYARLVYFEDGAMVRIQAFRQPGQK